MPWRAGSVGRKNPGAGKAPGAERRHPWSKPMEPPLENCKCSQVLSKYGKTRGAANPPPSTALHGSIRRHLYEKAGMLPSCCELCEAFELEQIRASVEWDD